MYPEKRTDREAYLDVRKTIRTVFRKWHWYLIAILIFVPAAVLFNKLATPQYLVSSSIYIKESSTSSRDKAQEFMQNFNLFSQQRAYQNEMLVIGSSPLIKEAIENLNLEVSYYKQDKLSYYEIYNLSPFEVLFDSTHVQPLKTNFDIVFSEDGSFKIIAEQKDVSVYNYAYNKRSRTGSAISINRTGLPGETIADDLYSFRVFITDADALQHIAGNRYRFRFNDIKQLTKNFEESLIIQPANSDVSIVDISMKSPSAEKAVVFIDELTRIYLQKNLDRKNYLAINTLKYINQQLNQIQDSLSHAEKKLEVFRSSKQILDITNKSTHVFDRLQQLEIERTTMEREHKYYQYLEDYFNNNTDLSDLVVPSSMGIPDKTLNDLIRDLIILVNQRNELIAKKQQKSPYLKNLEIQIENLQKPILENIRFAISTYAKNQADIQKTIDNLKSEASQLPKTERQLIGFERKFQLNDGIYTYLLQRQAEAQIAKSSNLPEHEIVEPARFVEIVYPNSRINYALALFAAFIFPTLLIFGIEYFDDRIKNEEDFKDNFKGNIIGSITQETSGDKSGESDYHTLLGESFRTIRTNINFLNKGQKVQTILVTSAVSGEGKSFTSMHLARTYAHTGQRTVLVGFDLRKSKQFSRISINAKKTLAEYYLGHCSESEIAIAMDQPNLSVIVPGVIPPNPLELIGSEKTEILFNWLKDNFDHIIIDTTPVGIVSDAFMLMHYAQVNIFVVRERFSRKRVIETVLDDMKSKEIENTVFVINDSRLANQKYRYNYYHPKKRKRNANRK